MANHIVSYWEELYNQRSDWALRAYDQVVNSLSSDIREKLKLSATTAEPYIVVFGKTQVGKTTLILDLIEIDPSHFSTVSTVLRGGRSSGKSATATAMEYCCSSNACWGITIDDNTEWHETNEAATEQLGELRELMERGQLNINSPCVIHIPRHYFKQQTNSVNVRILDLPGDNPANDNEKKHVYHIAKTYLPFADLILLVGRGDDLSYLSHNVITLPGIEDWQIMPHRFRIVTTYSYTAKSIKDKILADPEFDLNQIRQRLIEQIERFEPLSDAARNPDFFFPLEFGNSWNGLKASNPALYSKVSKIIEPLRINLIEQIHESVTTSGRLRSFLNTHTSIKKIWDNKKEVLQESIIIENKKISTIESEIEFINKVISLNIRKIERLEEDYAAVQKFKKNDFLTKKIKSFLTIQNPISYSDKSRDHLLSCISKLVRQLNENSQNLSSANYEQTCEEKKYLKMAKKFGTKEVKIEQAEIIEKAFEEIKQKLHNYHLDSYFWSDNYQSDIDQINSALESVMLKITSEFMNKSEIMHAALLKKMAGDISKNKIHRDNLEEQLISTKNSCNDLKEKIKNIEDSIIDIDAQSLEDIERFKMINQVIASEFTKDLSRKIDEALHNDEPSESFIQLLSCLDISQHYKEIIEFG